MIVSKDENLKESMPYIGCLILRELNKSSTKQIGFLDLVSILKKQDISRYRPILFGLTFLHSVGAIEFAPPFITLTDSSDSNAFTLK